VTAELAPRRPTALGTLEMAERALAEAKTLPEVALLVDGAELMKTYARKARLGHEAQSDWAIFKLRAEHKAGEMLREEPNYGRGKKSVTVTDFGINESQATRWQRLAVLPEKLLDDYRAERRFEQDQELTTAGFLKFAERKVREDAASSRPAPTVVVDSATGEVLHGDFRELEVDKVKLILTDPPYPKQHLPLWSDLGAWAAKTLADDGLLIAYSGQYHLPEVLGRLGAHLNYVWTFALITQGPAQQVQAVGARSRWKPLLLFTNGTSRRLSRFDDLLESPRRSKDEHPWEQTVDPLVQLIEAFTEPGDLVCDPFLGSGSTAVAAQQAGRQFWGCDVDEVALAHAKERLA
jgi:DNA methylase